MEKTVLTHIWVGGTGINFEITFKFLKKFLLSEARFSFWSLSAFIIIIIIIINIIIFNSRTVNVKQEWNFYLYSHPHQEARSKPIHFLSGSCKGYCIHLYQGPAYVQAWQSITYAVFLPAKDITVRVDASSFCCSLLVVFKQPKCYSFLLFTLIPFLT